jgi:hypothetical protein
MRRGHRILTWGRLRAIASRAIVLKCPERWGASMPVVFKAGETIIRDGEEGNTAFYIVNGTVDVILG